MLKKHFLRRIIAVILIAFTFLFVDVLSNNLIQPAQAQVMTPEEYAEQANTLNRNMDSANHREGYYREKTFEQSQESPIEKAKTSLKEGAENIKEKLNLDEPVPQATKDFLHSTQQKVEETVEPITGTEHGYYQYKNRD